MTSAIFNSRQPAIVSTGELTELVRGQDQSFLARYTPLVRRQSVSLDLGRIERIDAAGIAALIALYGSAHESGHEFSVFNPSSRVAEILNLVGLEQFLVTHATAREPLATPCYSCPAA